MKKFIYLFLTLFTIITYGQADFPEGVQISGGQPTVTSVNFLTTTDNTLSGLQGKIAPVNLPIPYSPTNYSISNQSIGQHLTGIDTRLGQISSTTAGITQRVYFTADNTTVTAGTFFTSSLTGKGSTATGSPPALVLADNTKGYFTKDVISVAFPAATIGYAGSYTGQLTVSATPTPVATQQRFTVEIYRTDNGGTPIASGVSGAPTGDLGVTVVAILDSGILNLTAGSITNIPVTGILTQNITLNTGERLRYHVSAAKIGTGGGSVTFGVYYGSSYNSYYDVPVAITTDAVLNKSTVTGVTDTDALNNLNSGKIGGTGGINYIPFFTSAKNLSFTELYTDSSLNINKDKIAQPTAAPTAVVSATTGVLNGNYYYSCSYYTAVGETEANVSTGVLAVALKQVNLSNIPISPDSEVIGRRIYRTSGTAISGVHGKKLLVDIPNNTTTTYVDNVPDGSLGVPLAWTNTTSGVYKQNGVTVFDTSGGNLQVGFGAVARGYANTAVGSFSMAANVSGLRNSAFALYALYSNVDGEENTAGGVHALNYNVNGSFNTAWGYGTLFNNLGSRNTAIGRGAYEFNVNGNGLVALGHNAGNLETGSDKLYIDNQNRGSEALGRTSALVYGVFDAVPANQTIRFNATASALNLSGTNTGDAYAKNITDTQTITSTVPVFFDSTASPSNSPTGSDVFVQGFQVMSNGNSAFKQIVATNGTDLYYRAQSNSVWGSWKKMWNSTNSNISSVDWNANNLILAGKATAGTAASSANDLERKGEHDADLALKSNISSPTFTGDPKAPTAPVGDNDMSIATTAFVQANARPYKVYSALLTQTGTSAPTAIVLENNTGATVTWSRTSVGTYTATFSSAVLTSNKVACFVTNGVTGSSSNNSSAGRSSTTEVTLGNNVAGSLTDLNADLSFEVRIYN